MKTFKVSACIITYNQEAYIRECLDGAINQVVDFEYEIVIGEDCSTDGTLAICKEYATKYPNLIKLIPRSENLGMAGNWVNTIRQCSGKYIALCEGDDYWTDPAKLQQQVDFLESNPDYSFCFHSAKVVNVSGAIVEDYLTTVPEAHETLTDLAARGNYIHTPTVVFRNIIREFPRDFMRSPILDHFLYIMLGHHGKVKYINRPMAHYRHGVGIFSSLSSVKLTANRIRFFSCLLAYLNDEEIKKIILERQFEAIEKFNRNAEYAYSSNDYLATKKSVAELTKIIVKKSIKK